MFVGEISVVLVHWLVLVGIHVGCLMVLMLVGQIQESLKDLHVGWLNPIKPQTNCWFNLQPIILVGKVMAKH